MQSRLKIAVPSTRLPYFNDHVFMVRTQMKLRVDHDFPDDEEYQYTNGAADCSDGECAENDDEVQHDDATIGCVHQFARCGSAEFSFADVVVEI